MKKLAGLLAVLLLASCASAQAVVLPTEVKVQPGRLASVTVQWQGDDLRWDVPPDLDCFREYDPDPARVRLRLIGYAPGRYRLLAVAAKGGKLSDFASCTIVVGEPGPTPPGPVDPLAQALQQAFLQETSANRLQLLGDLAALHRSVADSVKTNTNLKTNADALNLLRAAVANHPTLKGGALLAVKSVVTGELNRLGLYDIDPLTPDNRARVAAVLIRTADLMGGLK